MTARESRSYETVFPAERRDRLPRRASGPLASAKTSEPPGRCCHENWQRCCCDFNSTLRTVRNDTNLSLLPRFGSFATARSITARAAGWWLDQKLRPLHRESRSAHSWLRKSSMRPIGSVVGSGAAKSRTVASCNPSERGQYARNVGAQPVAFSVMAKEESSGGSKVGEVAAALGIDSEQSSVVFSWPKCGCGWSATKAAGRFREISCPAIRRSSSPPDWSIVSLFSKTRRWRTRSTGRQMEDRSTQTILSVMTKAANCRRSSTTRCNATAGNADAA